MAGSIICGVDDSSSAMGAVRVAHALGAMLGRRLVFVRVVEPSPPENEIDAIAERLRRLADREANACTEALWLVDVGHPADRLVAAATDEEASLIVVGSHGARSSLLGSISSDIARRAPCPVVVVPPGADVMANLNDGLPFAGVDRTHRSRLQMKVDVVPERQGGAPLNVTIFFGGPEEPHGSAGEVG